MKLEMRINPSEINRIVDIINEINGITIIRQGDLIIDNKGQNVIIIIVDIPYEHPIMKTNMLQYLEKESFELINIDSKKEENRKIIMEALKRLNNEEYNKIISDDKLIEEYVDNFLKIRGYNPYHKQCPTDVEFMLDVFNKYGVIR